jgi:hyperosmotically inducible periplasmic protein
MRSRLKFAKGAIIGATAVYYLDPDRGRARRARARDQLMARGRRVARSAGRRARSDLHRAKGRVVRSLGGGRFHPVDDHALADHLRGVLGRLDVPTDHLTTEVVGGVVRVRGQVERAADAEVVTSALAVEPGVRRVEDLTHAPDETAPNKVAGITASRRARGRRAS